MTSETTPPKASRRAVLRTAAAIPAIAAIPGQASPSQAGGRTTDPVRRTGLPSPKKPALNGTVQGTTLDRTLILRTPPGGGYRSVVAGPGEPHLLRRDLGGTAAPRRQDVRRPIIAFGHLTDVHVVDAQSPARVEYLDRCDDPGSFLHFLPFQSAYRPQEALTTHVADAMVRALNRIRRAPATGVAPAFTINTGDAADNVQYNELRWVIDILDGRKITPDSGDLTRYEGVMDWTAYDPSYWHPDGPPPGLQADHALTKYGFPTIPGLLDAARRPFHAEGLKTPWLAVLGNHDGLLQGNLPAVPLLNAIATGNLKITAPATESQALDIAEVFRNGDVAKLRALTAANRSTGLFRVVTPDPKRRLLSTADVVREHFAGGADGHGFTRENLAKGTAYYGFTRGRMRGLVLDTVNPNGYADGSIDEAQYAWLERELRACSSRYLAADGSVVTQRAYDRLFVIFSHHTTASMGNGLGGGRVLGDQITALLLRFPNVVLWVNGHTHVNEIVAHARPGNARIKGGFWEVSTAAHIDWPQQSRMIELADNTDGTLSIFTTTIDSAAPESWRGGLGGGTSLRGHTPDPVTLAALSRELSGNDWQENGDARRGKPEDRNVELLVPAPFSLTKP